MSDMPDVTYRGHFQDGALIATADGTVLAVRGFEQDAGVVAADVEIGRTVPLDPIPDRFWLHRRGLLAAYAWHSQRLHGRRWYERNVRAHPQAPAASTADSGPDQRSAYS